MSRDLLGKDALAAAMRNGNVNIAGSMQFEVMDLNEDSKAEQVKHAEALRKYEAQRKAMAVIVPTAAEDVKTKLRELGHPVTLFGEGPGDRRERLREVIAALELDDEELKKLQEIINKTSGGAVSSSAVAFDSKEGQAPGKASQKEVFYTAASEALIAVRQDLADKSFARAQSRILHTKQMRNDEMSQGAEDKRVLDLYKCGKDIILNSSQFGDERPLSCVRYAPGGAIAATGSLSCGVKLWDVKEMTCIGHLRGHEERITSVAWHPDAVLTASGSSHDSKSGTLIAASSADGSCSLWRCGAPTDAYEGGSMDVEGSSSSGNGGKKLSAERVRVSRGHQGVVTSCEFHPCGSLLGTTSHDYTWRLWDIETGTELLLQDGHSKECSALSFHHDGSLVLTTDWAGVGLLWDLRSGQQVFINVYSGMCSGMR